MLKGLLLSDLFLIGGRTQTLPQNFIPFFLGPLPGSMLHSLSILGMNISMHPEMVTTFSLSVVSSRCKLSNF